MMSLLDQPIVMPKGARLVVTLRNERPIKRKGVTRLSAREIAEEKRRAARIDKKTAELLAKIDVAKARIEALQTQLAALGGKKNASPA